MIFQNIDFHNVDELVKTENGFLLQRVNNKVLPFLSDAVKTRIAYFGTGVELRFCVGSNNAEIELFLDESRSEGIITTRPIKVSVFYGDFQSGYQTPDFYLKPGLNKITVSVPEEIGRLKAFKNDYGYGFDPSVIRLILPQNIVEFVGAKGDIILPKKEQYPKKSVLFYGSSITNGADSMATPATFAFRTAKHYDLDYFNLGFSGNAMLEKEMAEYISERKDWDYACIELGANVSGSYSLEKFYNYVKTFIGIMVKSNRPVFCTDLFSQYCDIEKNNEKLVKMREIVKECAEEAGVYYISGTTLLPPNPKYISSDGVHPSVDGFSVLSENYFKYFGDFLNK